MDDPNIGKAVLLAGKAYTILSKADWPGADYYYLGTPDEDEPIVRNGGLIRAALGWAEVDPNLEAAEL